MALKGFIKGLLGEKEVVNDINDKYFLYDKIFDSSKFMSVILNGKCGIIEKDGWKEVLPCNYQDVYDVAITYKHDTSCCVLCLKTGKWIYLDNENWKEKYPCNEPYLYSYLSESNVAVIKNDKKFTLIDKKGNTIQSYENLIVCRNVLFAQDQIDKWSILDRTTLKAINHFLYDDVKYITRTHYYYFVLRSGRYGIIDSRTGSEVISCKYDAFKETEDGMIPICLDDKWGFLDRDTLEEKIPCAYQDVSKFYGNYAAVKQRGKWGAINIKGDKVILSKFKNVLPTPSGLFCVWEDDITYCKIIDSKEWVKYNAKAKYEDLVKPYADGLLNVASGTSYLHNGVFSIKAGTEIVACYKYDYCHYIGGYGFTGNIYVEKGDKKGLCNLTGKEIIPCRYDECSSSGRIELNGKKGYYDGYERVPCIYDDVEELTKNFYRVKLRNKTLYYNTLTKEEIKSFDYTIHTSYISSDSILVIKKDDKYGLFSLREMKEIIPCKCDEVKDYTRDFVAFKKNGKWGLFNFQGKPIIIKHTEEEKPKESRSANAKQDNPVTKAPKETTKSTDIDTLISASIIDGELSDKERKVLMKKAKLAGLDVDEFEILLDAKLYEVQSKEDKKAAKSKQEKKTAKPKVEKKVAKLKEEKKAEKAKTEKKATKSKVEKDARTEKKEKVKAKTTEKPKSNRKVAKEEKKPIKKASTKVAKSKK